MIKVKPIIEMKNPKASGHAECGACYGPPIVGLRLGNKQGEHSTATITPLCRVCAKKVVDRLSAVIEDSTVVLDGERRSK